MMKQLLISAIIALVFVGCQIKSDNNPVFESAWVTYTDSIGGPVKQLCEVNYYVNGDTLFMSEKFHFLTLAYSFDDDNKLMYQHIIYCDKEQQPNVDGCYHVTFDRNDIPREPNTHLSAIILRNCITPLRPARTGEDHANAYLFNATIEMARGRDRNTLSPQLSKLLLIIK